VEGKTQKNVSDSCAFIFGLCYLFLRVILISAYGEKNAQEKTREITQQWTQWTFETYLQTPKSYNSSCPTSLI